MSKLTGQKSDTVRPKKQIFPNQTRERSSNLMSQNVIIFLFLHTCLQACVRNTKLKSQWSSSKKIKDCNWVNDVSIMQGRRHLGPTTKPPVLTTRAPLYLSLAVKVVMYKVSMLFMQLISLKNVDPSLLAHSLILDCH